ncbi:MAG TPA: ABC transporter permease subunit [Candidatus Didemnitutus sp.]|nr:ABC transporter permease subunit [Candidatus Didemnitutus sp.]
MKPFKYDWLILPLITLGVFLAIWAGFSARDRAHDDSNYFPGPTETWHDSKGYITQPLAYRGEQDQGILRFTWASLYLVGKGYFLGLLLGVPVGLLLGLSPTFTKAFDPIIQILRPISPLAWFPIGLGLFKGLGSAGLFTIAFCSMWPTVLNTAQGVRAVPQDYLNVGRVLRLSRLQMLWKIIIPSTLPYMFTGFRLSLGLAWLVIVAVEMLTGAPGLGGFLWQEYNALNYRHIVMCVISIGIIGFLLDRLMSFAETRLRAAT